MVQGTPVVCSDIPALREVAGGHAQLVPPGDRSRWSEALEALWDDPSRRAALAAGARAHAATFSWERTAEATRSVYDEVT